MCCHMFLPACVFLSGLGNIPVTEMEGSPFPHGGAVLNMGGCPISGVAISPTTDVGADAGITGICTSTGMDGPASSGKNPP